jgi:hypothetical protein
MHGRRNRSKPNLRRWIGGKFPGRLGEKPDQPIYSMYPSFGYIQLGASILAWVRGSALDCFLFLVLMYFLHTWHVGGGIA